MAQMGNGYGSECHLLRWMGRHREDFNAEIKRQCGFDDQSILNWLDFDFDKNAQMPGWPDRELKGLSFLTGQYADISEAWKKWWPQSGNVQNWDAVGWITTNGSKLLLVEAKAHRAELKGSNGCTAKGSGRTKIDKALHETREYISVENDHWMADYYQFANRIATLAFLNELCRKSGCKPMEAHLVMIYFCGDLIGKKRETPADREQWAPILQEQDDVLGIPDRHPLSDRIHKVFLTVC